MNVNLRRRKSCKNSLDYFPGFSHVHSLLSVIVVEVE
jgi:hypothetical protein